MFKLDQSAVVTFGGAKVESSKPANNIQATGQPLFAAPAGSVSFGGKDVKAQNSPKQEKSVSDEKKNFSFSFVQPAPAPTSSEPSLFGGKPANGESLFGNPKPTEAGLFSKPAEGGLFGGKPVETKPAASSSLFGEQKPAGGLFGGEQKPAGGLFGGEQKPAEVKPSGLFGGDQKPSAGLFGDSKPAEVKPSNSLFGDKPQSGLFGNAVAVPTN